MQERNYIRHPSTIPIEYNLVDVVHDQKEYLKNISIGGLCFRSNKYLEKGATVLIRIPLTKPIFKETGIIVWCNKRNAHYDVGVQFTDEGTGFRVRMIEQICYIEQYKHEVFEKEGRRLSGEEAAVEWINKYAREFPGR